MRIFILYVLAYARLNNALALQKARNVGGDNDGNVRGTWCRATGTATSGQLRPALIMVDAQEGFTLTYREQVKEMVAVSKAFNQAGWPIYTKGWFHPGADSAQGRFYGIRDADTCVACMRAQNVFSKIPTNNFNSPIESLMPTGENLERFALMSSFNSFNEANLKDMCQENINTVYILGGWTEHCIISTALFAKSVGFDVVVIGPAVGGSFLRKTALEFLRMLGTRVSATACDLPSYAKESAHMTFNLDSLGPMWPGPQYDRRIAFDALRGHDLNLLRGLDNSDAWIAGAFIAHWDLLGRWVKSGKTKSTVSNPDVRMQKFRRHKPQFALLLSVPCEASGPWRQESYDNVLQLVTLMQESSRAIYTLPPGPGNCTHVLKMPQNASTLTGHDIRLSTNGLQQIRNSDTLIFAGDLSNPALTSLAYRAFDLDFDVVIPEDAVLWGAAISKGMNDEMLLTAKRVLMHAIAYVTSTNEIVNAKASVKIGTSGYMCADKTIEGMTMDTRLEAHGAGPCIDLCDQNAECTMVAYNKIEAACSFSIDPLPSSAFEEYSDFSSNCSGPGANQFSLYFRYIDAASQGDFFQN